MPITDENAYSLIIEASHVARIYLVFRHLSWDFAQPHAFDEP